MKEITDIENKIIEEYKNGAIINNLVKKYNKPFMSISYLLKKAGVFKSKGVKKYKYNEMFFNKIDTEEKAYWLGFIAADGNVINKPQCTLHIGLNAIDANHLNKFITAIDSNAPVKTTKYYSKNKLLNLSRIDIHNKQIVYDLSKYGVVPNKTKIIEWNKLTDNIPTNLVRHFVRGYFDGDGSWKYYKNRITFNVCSASIYNFLEHLQNWLILQLNVKQTKIYKRFDGFQALEYSGNLQCKKIYNLLYDDSTIRLDRKYNSSTVFYSKLDNSYIFDSLGMHPR